MNETWKPIRGFPNYAISDHGRVTTIKTELIKVGTPNQQGVVSVNLMEGGRQCRKAIAPMVLEHFRDPHPNPLFNTPINKDGDRFNNHIDNLEWRPRWFAIKYHQQFKQPLMAPYEVHLRHIETGEEFARYFEACKRFGLLERALVLSVMNSAPCPPTYDRFELLEV